MRGIKEVQILDELRIELQKNDLFASFKWLKSKKKLVQKDKAMGIEKAIEFDLYETVTGLDSYQQAYRLSVNISVRFNVLHNWFEPFYKGSQLSDYKNRCTFFESIMDRGDNGFVYFDVRGVGFENKLKEACEMIISKSKLFFSGHVSLEDVYKMHVFPIISQNVKLQDIGSTWIFEYLALTKIVDPEHFEKLLEVLHTHLQKLYTSHEPNAIDYFPVFHEAVEELRVCDL